MVTLKNNHNLPIGFIADGKEFIVSPGKTASLSGELSTGSINMLNTYEAKKIVSIIKHEVKSIEVVEDIKIVEAKPKKVYTEIEKRELKAKARKMGIKCGRTKSIDDILKEMAKKESE